MMMVRKLKAIVALLLITALFWPSVIKLDHHHFYIPVPGTGEQLTVVHEKCPACSFEYSIFISDSGVKGPERAEVICERFCFILPLHILFSPRYSFFLRAPPEKMI
ncbi:MAG TPA: hypothetical protein PLJ84_00410 [Bacteroidales bacterium]|nr:hypothetical protein [Bacteroidales bacterium]HPT01031.1 hypothetical protein [Bacteroidales bacterium]